MNGGVGWTKCGIIGGDDAYSPPSLSLRAFSTCPDLACRFAVCLVRRMQLLQLFDQPVYRAVGAIRRGGALQTVRPLLFACVSSIFGCFPCFFESEFGFLLDGFRLAVRPRFFWCLC